MSAFAYGRIIKARGAKLQAAAIDAADKGAAGQGENKLIAALAGIVPVEIIAGHALVLAATTTKDAAGTVVITGPEVLKWSLIGLLVVAGIVFVIGRGLANWEPDDYVRFLLPLFAFVVWTALIGTSALTPWVANFDNALVTVVAVLAGTILVFVSAKVAPPTT